MNGTLKKREKVKLGEKKKMGKRKKPSNEKEDGLIEQRTRPADKIPSPD